MKNIPIIILFTILWLASCKPVEVLRTDTLLPSPDAFASATADTTNSATLNWREYFNDPFLEGLIDTALANNLDLKMAVQRIKEEQVEITEEMPLTEEVEA